MTSNEIDFSRETALKILYEINEKQAYSNIAINNYLSNTALRNIDKEFITGLVYGTIKWKLTIDWIIERFSSIPVKKISPWIFNILRLGIYQLLYTDRIPASAACNESVKLALKYGHRASANFVNGVLRNIDRNRSRIEYPFKDSEKPDEKAKYLSLRYSYPEWLVKNWLQLYGDKFTVDLLESGNENPDFTIKVNTLKISVQEFEKIMEERGIKYYRGKYIDSAFIIENPAVLTGSGILDKGYCHVQDESSMLAVEILDPQPGELVMDVCAAPGGKSAYMAEKMGNKGLIISRDIYQHKIKLITTLAQKLGINIIKAELHNATLTDQEHLKKADRVLVDAPCTGLGIIRRKPDIKWARTPEEKEEITRLQLNILKASAEYVKPGGVLVYSTCTIGPEENMDVVRNFLDSNSGFYMEGFDEKRISENILKDTAREGYIELFPNIDKTDGFFVARMRRR